MNRLKYSLKTYDYVLIILSILISFTPHIVTQLYFSQNDSMVKVALVKIQGKIVDEFDLIPNGGQIEKTYHPKKNQYNIIEVSNDKIRIKEDNSPDQIGVRTGWISKSGQVAVCLPHQFMIEIKGSPSSDDLILPLQ